MKFINLLCGTWINIDLIAYAVVNQETDSVSLYDADDEPLGGCLICDFKPFVATPSYLEH